MRPRSRGWLRCVFRELGGGSCGSGRGGGVVRGGIVVEPLEVGLGL